GGGGTGGRDAAASGGSGGGTVNNHDMDARVPEAGTDAGDAGTTHHNDAQVGSDGAVGCKSDELSCDDVCVANDARNCGKGGHDCTGLPFVAGTVSCDKGACVIPPSACAAGHGHCTSDPDDGCETDLTLPAHCGGCDTSCDSDTPLCVAPTGGGAS